MGLKNWVLEQSQLPILEKYCNTIRSNTKNGEGLAPIPLINAAYGQKVNS